MDINGLREEIREVLNKNDADTFAGVPDYILADHLMDALITFRKTHRNANTWRGIPDFEPGQKVTVTGP